MAPWKTQTFFKRQSKSKHIRLVRTQIEIALSIKDEKNRIGVIHIQHNAACTFGRTSLVLSPRYVQITKNTYGVLVKTLQHHEEVLKIEEKGKRKKRKWN